MHGLNSRYTRLRIESLEERRNPSGLTGSAPTYSKETTTSSAYVAMPSQQETTTTAKPTADSSGGTYSASGKPIYNPTVSSDNPSWLK